MQQPKIVKIISWNCRGLNFSLPYVEVLADNADKIVLSEHWLWPFDLHKFDGIHPDMKGTAVADSRLSPDSELSRGCEGVGIAWKKHLQTSPVSGYPSDRICAITVESTTFPFFVIGVYLPTSDCSCVEYSETLIIIEHIINDHPDQYAIVIGDFNAHTGPNGGSRSFDTENVHVQLLLDLVSRNDLFISSLSTITQGPCYTYFLGKVRTTMDYFIIDATLASLITDSRVLKHDPLNKSDHLPLSTTFSLSYVTANSNNITSHTKVNWRKATKDGSLLTYQAKVRDIITPLLNKEYTCRADLDEEISFVSEKLSQIALSTPLLSTKEKKEAFCKQQRTAGT